MQIKQQFIMKNYIATLVLALCCFLWVSASAQEFTPSFGIRTGDYAGFNARLKYTDNIALEGIIGWKNRGTIVTALVQKIKPLTLPWADGFEWYYGLGAHFGFSSAKDNNHYQGVNYWNEPMYKNAFVAGVDGIVGIDYTFTRIPFSICLDVKPLVELYDITHLNVRVFEFGLSIRYQLGRSFLY